MLDLTIRPAPKGARHVPIGVFGWKNIAGPLLPQVEAAIATPSVTVLRFMPNAEQPDDLTGVAEALAKAKLRFWLTVPAAQIGGDPVECATWAAWILLGDKEHPGLDPTGKLCLGVEACNEPWCITKENVEWHGDLPDVDWHRHFFGELFSRTGLKLVLPIHHTQQALGQELARYAGVAMDVHYDTRYSPDPNTVILTPATIPFINNTCVSAVQLFKLDTQVLVTASPLSTAKTLTVKIGTVQTILTPQSSKSSFWSIVLPEGGVQCVVTADGAWADVVIMVEGSLRVRWLTGGDWIARMLDGDSLTTDIWPFLNGPIPLIVGESGFSDVDIDLYGLHTAMHWLGVYIKLCASKNLADYHWHGDGIGMPSMNLPIQQTPMWWAFGALRKLQKGKPLVAGIESGNGLYALASMAGAIVINCGLTRPVRVRGKRVASIAWLTTDDVSNAWTLAECKDGWKRVRGQTVMVRTGINWIRWRR